MKKLFLTIITATFAFSNLQASVVNAKAATASLPAGFLILITILSVLLIVGIVWAILRPIRRRRRAPVNIPPPPPRVRARPRRSPRRRVIIVR